MAVNKRAIDKESFKSDTRGLKKKYIGPPCIVSEKNNSSGSRDVTMRGLKNLCMSCFECRMTKRLSCGFKIHNPKAVESWVVLYLPKSHPSELPCLRELLVADVPVMFNTKQGGMPAPLYDIGREIGRETDSKKDRSKAPQKRSEALSLESVKVVDELLDLQKFPTTGVKFDKIEGSGEGFAIDCEMCMSGSDSVLTRFAVIRFSDGEVLIDQLVKPSVPISDYVTQYSGISEEMLRDVTFSLADAQEWLRSHIGASDILIGHSIDNDLNALQMQHRNIIDTSLLFPHYRGLPFRSSLKYLAKKHVGWDIQQASENGHNPVDDADACVRLVRKVLDHGLEFTDERLEYPALTKCLSDLNCTSTIIGPQVPTWDGMGTADHIIEQDPAACVAAVLKAREDRQFVCCTLESSEPETLEEHVRQLLLRLPKRTLVTAILGTEENLQDELALLERKRMEYRRQFKIKSVSEIEDSWTAEDESRLKVLSHEVKHGRVFVSITYEEGELEELPEKIRTLVLPSLKLQMLTEAQPELLPPNP